MGAKGAWEPIVRAHRDGIATRALTAVIDNGVQLDHPDLKDQLEPGTEFPCTSAPCDGGDPEAIHGTAMAGIIAAARDNRGMVGIAWNTRLLPIAISKGEGSQTFEQSAVDAIRFAVTKGARVLNFSYAGNQPTPQLKEELETNQGDFLFVVPAGGLNSGAGTIFPGSYLIPRMFVVMCHDEYGNAVGHTGGESRIEIAARGDTHVTRPCAKNEPGGCFTMSVASTSNASAFVSGAAALLWSIHNDWTADEIKKHILNTADHEQKLHKIFDPPLRLNLDRMMNPVVFTNAVDGKVRLADLSRIDTGKAFPPGMSNGKIVSRLVKEPADDDHAIDAIDVRKRDLIRIVTTCERNRGGESKAYSRVYEVID
jgi:hypothetical protein